jgi:hypothetical protein
MADKDDDKDEVQPGMDVPALKRMLAIARRSKMNAAIAQGDPKSGGLGLILLDKVMPPKQVLKTLKDQAPKASKFCFGTASVDMETDRKLVTFRMNKKVPGLDRRLRKALKGTGYNKVAIQTGDGGA